MKNYLQPRNPVTEHTKEEVYSSFFEFMHKVCKTLDASVDAPPDAQELADLLYDKRREYRKKYPELREGDLSIYIPENKEKYDARAEQDIRYRFFREEKHWENLADSLFFCPETVQPRIEWKFKSKALIKRDQYLSLINRTLGSLDLESDQKSYLVAFLYFTILEKPPEIKSIENQEKKLISTS